MDQVNFTKVEDAKNIESGFVYLAVVNDLNHNASDYQFLIYKNDEFLIWCEDISQYVEIEDDYEVIEIAKLNKHGGAIGSDPI